MKEITNRSQKTGLQYLNTQVALTAEPKMEKWTKINVLTLNVHFFFTPLI